jgi:hypothetical protein
MMIRQGNQLEIDNSKYDLLSAVMSWESGEITGSDELKMFMFLTEHGIVYQLPEAYLTRAKELGFIENN